MRVKVVYLDEFGILQPLDPLDVIAGDQHPQIDKLNKRLDEFKTLTRDPNFEVKL